MLELSAADARRLALAAQGFARPRPGSPDLRSLRGVARRIHVFQLDSITTLMRAHYLPAFSRLGAYPAALLDRLAYEQRHLFEFPAHAAALLRTELHPLMRWRMDTFAKDRRWIGNLPQARLDALVSEVADRGPLAASDLTKGSRRDRSVWSRTPGRNALQWLHWSGRLAVSGRRAFQPLYDLAERVIPSAILDTPTPPPDEAKKQLLCLAADALGVATAKELADYFHLGIGHSGMAERAVSPGSPKVEHLLREITEDGRLSAVRVEGWREVAYVARASRPTARVDARALVSPFDSLVWHRPRLARLFGFDFGTEIYVPEPKRRYGYYVLPFLLGEAFVARVDLKLDRGRGLLQVHGAFKEAGNDPAEVVAGLTEEVVAMAGWLGARGVEIGERGDLAADLRRALARREADVLAKVARVESA